MLVHDAAATDGVVGLLMGGFLCESDESSWEAGGREALSEGREDLDRLTFHLLAPAPDVRDRRR